MDIRPLEDRIHATPQIRLEDIQAIADAGYRSIVSNRPDEEEPGQPSADQVRAAARAAGLEFRHIPVRPGALGPEQVQAFAEALETLPQPILAFCRTGTRSTMLWGLSQAGERPAEEILSRAAAVGYDLTPLRAALGD